MKQKYNILIIAYACEPNKTSEPGVGWNFMNELSKKHTITVVTRSNNKKVIESHSTNSNFIYFDLPLFFKILKKNVPFGVQFYFLIWQTVLYFKIAYKHQFREFNLIHHLNFSTLWNPPLFFLLKKPFIWGPVGGADFMAFKFAKYLTPSSIFSEFLYFLIGKLSKILVNIFFILKKPDALILRTNSARSFFKLFPSKNIFIVSETAINEVEMKIKTKQNKNFLNVISVGRMNYWKGFFYAVKGFHNFLESGGKGKLELFGNGSEILKIKNYIKSHKLEKNIFVNGHVSNDIIQKKLNSSDVLLHPSFRDGGSWSVLEAMSNSLVTIALDCSGVKDMVSDKCGILIKLQSHKQISNDIGVALLKLHYDNKEFERLSKNAFLRVKNHYNWNDRGDQINKIYNNVLKNYS